MAYFKDITGQEWSIEFDGLLLDRARSETSLDLGDLSGKAYVTIENDIASLVKVLAVLCREQIETRKVTREAFAKLIRKDVIVDAIAAIMAAAADFFPTRTWSAVQSRLSAASQMYQETQAIAPLMEILNSPSIPERMKEAVLDAMAEEMKRKSEGAGTSTSSTKSPEENSASGQDVTPSSAATVAPANAA